MFNWYFFRINFSFFGHLQEITFYSISSRFHSNIIEYWRYEVWDEEEDDDEFRRWNDNQSSRDNLRHPDEEVEPGRDKVLPDNKSSLSYLQHQT